MEDVYFNQITGEFSLDPGQPGFERLRADNAQGQIVIYDCEMPEAAQNVAEAIAHWNGWDGTTTVHLTGSTIVVAVNTGYAPGFEYVRLQPA